MKIQKGMVKYKDRNDIVCMYGVTDDGKTYYFLDSSDGKTFSNGNRVVSTELVEAIDPMVKSSNVGVIDSEGNEVIKCENKAVKLVNDNVVLVEKANPVTESVISAIGYRSDPLYAAKLVSTPAQIKDNIYREMGNDGRFLFNDQFAEATVCDIDGNNLVNDEVYSFVAMNNNHLYLSKNTPDSSVVHFALGENKVEEDVSSESVEKENEVVTASEVVEGDSATNLEQTENESEIDVSEVNVPIDVVEGALEGEATTTQESNVIQDNFEIDSSTPIENVNEGLVAPSADEFLAASSVGTPNSVEYVMSGSNENVAVNADNQVSDQSDMSSENVDDSMNNAVNDSISDAVNADSGELLGVGTEVQENTSSEEVVVDSNVTEGTETTEVPNEEVVGDTTENDQNVEAVPGTDEFVLEGTETTEAPSEEVVHDTTENNDAVEEVTGTEEFVTEGTETTEVPSEEVVGDTTENDQNVEAVPGTDEFVTEGTETTEVSSEEVVGDTTDNNDTVEEVTGTEEFVTEGTETTEVPSEEVAHDTTENNDTVEEVTGTEEFVTEGTETTDVPREEVVHDENNDTVESVTDEVDTPLNEEDIQSLLDETSTDLFNGSSLKVDTIVNDGFSQDELDSYAMSLQKMGEGSENLLGDVAKSMTGLIRQNREQRATIANYEEVINGLNSSKDELQGKVTSLEQENVELNDRNRSLENAVVKLKSRVEMLASKLQEKEEQISAQSHELQMMRPQLEGRDQLMNLLKDAQALIGEDKSSEEEYGYAKVA